MNKIGEGTFSRVVSDKENPSIAIKVSAECIPNVIKEIALIKYINHPNIITPLSISSDVHAVEYKIYMERYPLTLEDIISYRWKRSISQYTSQYTHNTCTYPPDCMLKVAIDIILAISHLHKLSIIHADIKPKNILFDMNHFSPVICDFNISIFFPKKAMSSCVQTINYRAPEINHLKKYIKFDNTIDVWSYGCILFEMFTGSKLIPNACFADSVTNAMCMLGLLATDIDQENERVASIPIEMYLIERKANLKILYAMTIDDVIACILEKIYGTGESWKTHIGILECTIERSNLDSIISSLVFKMSKLIARCVIPDSHQRWPAQRISDELIHMRRWLSLCVRKCTVCDIHMCKHSQVDGSLATHKGSLATHKGSLATHKGSLAPYDNQAASSFKNVKNTPWACSAVGLKKYTTGTPLCTLHTDVFADDPDFMYKKYSFPPSAVILDERNTAEETLIKFANFNTKFIPIIKPVLNFSKCHSLDTDIEKELIKQFIEKTNIKKLWHISHAYICLRQIACEYKCTLKCTELVTSLASHIKAMFCASCVRPITCIESMTQLNISCLYIASSVFDEIGEIMHIIYAVFNEKIIYMKVREILDVLGYNIIS